MSDQGTSAASGWAVSSESRLSEAAEGDDDDRRGETVEDRAVPAPKLSRRDVERACVRRANRDSGGPATGAQPEVSAVTLWQTERAAECWDRHRYEPSKAGTGGRMQVRGSRCFEGFSGS
jgi:hypothetical protein